VRPAVWCWRWQTRGATAPPSLKLVSIPTADQAAEIAQLRRECGRQRMERDPSRHDNRQAARQRGICAIISDRSNALEVIRCQMPCLTPGRKAIPIVVSR
jgi:hypothetical protein